MGWGIFIIKDPSIWHQISYSVCVNQNLKTQWPEDFWSPSYPVEFGKMNYIDLRPLKLKFPYIRMNCVCWWPLRQIVHSDVTGKVTEGFQLFICSLLSLKSIKIPCSRNQCSQLLGQFSCKKIDCNTSRAMKFDIVDEQLILTTGSRKKKADILRSDWPW